VELSIQLQLYESSFSDTVSFLECFGVERPRSTVHNRSQKPTDGAQPNHIELDETVIHLDDQRYWLYAAADPEMNELLHVRLFPTQNEGVISIFFLNSP